MAKAKGWRRCAGLRPHEVLGRLSSQPASLRIRSPHETGIRDHALLLFLYNSGARVTEAASLQIGDLNLRGSQIGDVQLRGKGNETRRCPLWPATATALLALVRDRAPDEPVFLNRLDQAITRHGIHWMLHNYVVHCGCAGARKGRGRQTFGSEVQWNGKPG